MSDTTRGHDWWQASDGRWYPPEQHPDRRVPPPPPHATAQQVSLPPTGPNPPGSTSSGTTPTDPTSSDPAPAGATSSGATTPPQQGAMRPRTLAVGVAAALVVLLGLSAVALLASSAVTSGGGATVPLSYEERCTDDGAVGCAERPAPKGTTFLHGDRLELTYVGSELERDDDGEHPNPTSVRVLTYLEITNTGTSPRVLWSHELLLRPYVAAWVDRQLAPCGFEYLPRDLDERLQLPEGETVTVRFCHAASGFPEHFDGEPSVRLSIGTASHAALLVEGQEPSQATRDSVVEGIDRLARSSDVDPYDVGRSQAMIEAGRGSELPADRVPTSTTTTLYELPAPGAWMGD